MRTGGTRSWRAWAFACVCVVALGCGEEAEPDPPTGRWSVEGLTRGTITLTEQLSDNEWVFTGNGDPQRAEVPLWFEVAEGGWDFAAEVDSIDPLECELHRSSGTLDTTGSGRPWPRIECGYPFEALHLPDPGLAACVHDALDGRNSSGINSLICPNRGIRDLTGIADFYNLTTLSLRYNEIEGLAGLDIDALGKLEWLDLSHNAISGTLDLSRFAGVRFFKIVLTDNEISDVTGLAGLDVGTLDLTGNDLERFEAPSTEGEPPASIDYLGLGGNALEHVDLRGLARAPNTIALSGNQLETLDLDFGEAWAPGPIHGLYVRDNLLSEAFIPGSASVRALQLPASGVRTLDISHNRFTEIPADLAGPELLDLIAAGNAITTFDLTSATGLNHLDVADNDLESLHMEGADRIRVIIASDNAITRFDWRYGVSKLYWLDLSGNPLSSLDTCNAPELDELVLDDSGIERIDLSGCPELWEISLEGNPLETLDLSPFPSLGKINVRDTLLPCDLIAEIERVFYRAEFAYDYERCPL